MLPFRHNPDDVLSPMHFTVPRPPPPPPPPLYHQNDGTPQFSILPTISRDTAQIDQDGRQAYHLPGREGGLGGAPVHLFSGSQSLTDSRSPSRSPSRTASIMTEEYEGGVDYPDSDDGRDKDPLDHSSVFTYSSVDSRSSRQQSWRRIQYSWRRRLRVQTRSSTLRNRHKVVSTVYGREGIASSLPDLGLYKTWDSRKALKVRA
ncbi:hypothetical protein N431DRAFT_389130 [Stipitochalara longipes BDJ]|nr:hypothetical protein N431DRAFT_389130 [Stipitochalara longipes BDJ]